MLKEQPEDTADVDIKEWAYSSFYEPMQDWDLIVSSIINDSLLLTLLSDRNCPKQIYFLHIAYFIIGDAVRTNYKSDSLERIQGLIEELKSIELDETQLLVTRAKSLIQDPSLFVYDDWCDGKLVNLDKEKLINN